MKQRTLGNTELEVSEVGFGLWTLTSGRWPAMREAEAERLLVSAFDLGVTFYDTADTYGDGYGESVLAKALGRQRHDVVIATKVGYDIYTRLIGPTPQPREQNFTPRYVRYACEQSLRRLDTDYIDLFQLHDPTMYTLEDDELFDTLGDLVREGKIRYFGYAPDPSLVWDEEAEAAMREREGHSLQLVYNILEQRPARDLFPIARETDTGLIAREPHGWGALAAPLATPDAQTDAGEEHEGERERGAPVPSADELASLAFLTRNLDATMAQLAIKFALSEPLVASALLDGGRENQLAVRGGRLLAPRLERRAAKTAGSVGVRGDRSYLVTGGLGYLGLELAAWLVRAGAGHVVLVGRRGPDAETRQRLAALEAETGCRLVTEPVDVEWDAAR